jgi:Na+-transporting NADH:ubiquinone oxidoreductase subunit NqrE
MLANVFGPALPIMVLLGIALPLWAVVDAMSRPAVAFSAARSNKTAWIVVLLVFTFILGIGLFLAAFYLVSVRRKVQQQMQLSS